ncbi:Glycosyl transferase family 2 [Cohnella sp. OV330]|uniref:glycosyltransferase family 2 protein n=1 Tax=Cohnella sp. OV330 TaxID=1855288 RepID=UPI0008EB77C3|nr:glycosyltransferase family 2 protein [Cohnella sp. OV330]SFA96980.1 Glycosyl transferase family 2 [Cohnella sp. OV330]
MTSVTVVVPSYRRPDDLSKCLEGLNRQLYPRYDVVIVVRSGDEETKALALRWLGTDSSYGKSVTEVSESGVLAAMKAGTNVALGDIIAYTDDDAVPRPDWLEKLVRHYADPRVGGVGGRDIQPGIPAKPGCGVGIVTWYGKLIGNHHIGDGPAREADVLKGVNMSLRRELTEFPQGLLGTGAQVHFEVHMCLRARWLGYKLIYDASAIVDHYPAPRFDEDQRGKAVPEAAVNAAYNLQLGILRWGGLLRMMSRFVYAAFVGDRTTPGLLRLAVAWTRGERLVVSAFIPGQQGYWRGLRRWMKTGRDRFRSASAGIGGRD